MCHVIYWRVTLLMSIGKKNTRYLLSPKIAISSDVGQIIIQTEAERRRREAGVKQSMEIRVRSCMWVGMYGIWNYLANRGT